MLIMDNNTDDGSIDPMEDQDQPDADYIKMFVGQVPRSMDEAQLREMFEEYGRVHTINVLRDKSTGLSKGKSNIQQKTIPNHENIFSSFRRYCDALILFTFGLILFVKNLYLFVSY